MATKQSSNRANKQAKRQVRAKQKQKAAAIETAKGKQLLGRRAQASMLTEGLDKMSNQDIITTARQNLRKINKLRKKVRQGKITQAEAEKRIAGQIETDEITNKTVMQNINDVIPAVIRVHAGAEIFTRLAGEKRYEVTAEEETLIASLDEQVTKITEDISAIIVFVEAGKEPEEYMDIFMHYTEQLAQMFEVTVPGMMTVLTPRQDVIDAYAQEHRNTDVQMFDYMRSLHEERMVNVYPIYRTQTSAAGDAVDLVEHAYTPENPMPMDPVVDPDIEEAVLVETPDIEQDVLREVNA